MIITLTPLPTRGWYRATDGKEEAEGDSLHSAIGELIGLILVRHDDQPVTVEAIMVTKPDGTDPLPYASGALWVRDCPEITDPDMIDILSNLR